MDQLQGIFARATQGQLELRREIRGALDDPPVSWKEVFDAPELGGDPLLAESDDRARDYALAIFGQLVE